MHKPKIYKPLLPLSYLYGLGVRLRNKLFDYDILHSRTFDIPVICVGNISVGGTGKTPHTEYLIRLLKDRYNVFVLSRGYKRKSKGFVIAREGHTEIQDIGDEPYQMWKKFPDINVVVDADRCNGISNILGILGRSGNSSLKSPVIILDDAYQHRYVKAGMYILLIDYNRPVHNDALLPAGRLREPESGKKRADIIIVSKCPKDISNNEQNEFVKAINPLPDQSIYFTYTEYENLQKLFPESPNGHENTNTTDSRTVYDLTSDTHILLLTGIASPKAIINKLKEWTNNIYLITFGDHHNFSSKDMETVKEKFLQLPEEKRIIITTEKDAARLISHPDLSTELKPYIYTLPIKVRFISKNEQNFNQKITEYVTENSRNSSLS